MFSLLQLRSLDGNGVQLPFEQLVGGVGILVLLLQLLAEPNIGKTDKFIRIVGGERLLIMELSGF